MSGDAPISTDHVSVPTGHLRFVSRKFVMGFGRVEYRTILQQEWQKLSDRDTYWVDVPLVEVQE